MDELKTTAEKALVTIKPMLDDAKNLAAAINDESSFQEAGSLMRMLKAQIRDVEAKLDPFVKAAHASWKTAVAERDKYIKPLNSALDALSVGMVEHKKRMDAIAERQQREAEALARKQAEDLRLEQAQAAQDSGDKARAEELLAAPVVPVPVVVPVEKPKAEGIGFRENYSVRVDDVRTLVKEVYEGRQPLVALLPNEKYLNEQARSLKKEYNIPGTTLVVTMGTATRA